MYIKNLLGKPWQLLWNIYDFIALWWWAQGINISVSCFHSKTTPIIFSVWSANCHITSALKDLQRYFLQSLATIFSVEPLQRSSGQKASAIDALKNFIGLCQPVGTLANDRELSAQSGLVVLFCTQSRGFSCVKFCPNLEAWQPRKVESWGKNTITWCSRKSPPFFDNCCSSQIVILEKCPPSLVLVSAVVMKNTCWHFLFSATRC